jgi:hypothetical protein
MSVRDAGKNIAGVEVVVLVSERGSEYHMAKSVFLYHLLIGRYKEV